MSAGAGHHLHRAARSEMSDAVENYAKAIYGLAIDGEAVSTNALAHRLGVTAASASGMVKRLAEAGIVEHQPYHGVSLTPEGRRIALGVVRRHRLLETYLAEKLGVPWDRVHDEAEVLEHSLSAELEEAIANALGDPTHDPHGDPIPTRDGRIAEIATVRLQDMEPGHGGRLERISDSDPEMLRYLAERGIAPGDRLEVISKQPFDGPLEVMIGDVVHVLGGGLAGAMRVALDG